MKNLTVQILLIFFITSCSTNSPVLPGAGREPAAKRFFLDLTVNNHTNIPLSQIEFLEITDGRCRGFLEVICDSNYRRLEFNKNNQYTGIFADSELHIEAKDKRFNSFIGLNSKVKKYVLDLWNFDVNDLKFRLPDGTIFKRDLVINAQWGTATHSVSKDFYIKNGKLDKDASFISMAIPNGEQAFLTVKAWPLSELPISNKNNPWAQLKLTGTPNESWIKEMENIAITPPENAGNLNGEWYGNINISSSVLPKRIGAALETTPIVLRGQCVNEKFSGDLKTFIKMDYDSVPEELDTYKIEGICKDAQISFKLKMKIKYYLKFKFYEDEFEFKSDYVGAETSTFQLFLPNTNENLDTVWLKRAQD